MISHRCKESSKELLKVENAANRMAFLSGPLSLESIPCNNCRSADLCERSITCIGMAKVSSRLSRIQETLTGRAHDSLATGWRINSAIRSLRTAELGR